MFDTKGPAANGLTSGNTTNGAVRRTTLCLAPWISLRRLRTLFEHGGRFDGPGCAVYLRFAQAILAHTTTQERTWKLSPKPR